MIWGAKTIVRTLNASAIANTRFKTVDASSHDSSRSRVVMYSTNTGTNTVARISPRMSWYTMFGSWFARL